MDSRYRYIVFDTKNKLFAIREGKGDKKSDYKALGLKVVDYGKQEITASDIELYQKKGFKFDPSGSFIG